MRARKEYRDEHLCPLCGLPKDICQAKGNEKAFDVDYVRCFAMKALHAEQRKLQADGKGAAPIEDPKSLSFSIGLRN